MAGAWLAIGEETTVVPIEIGQGECLGIRIIGQVTKPWAAFWRVSHVLACAIW